MKKVIGIIVNPIAGLGGKAGFKGSDDPEILSMTKQLGIEKLASIRAEQAVGILLPLKNEFEFITCSGEMGEETLQNAGFKPKLIDVRLSDTEKTSGMTTQFAAKKMADIGIDLLLFAGGDGTARDIYTAVGTEVPVLGIPAGVKIHSSVYAINPRNAGEVALMFLKGQTIIQEAEVMDIDEIAFRKGEVIAKLYGYLKVPLVKQKMQGVKTGSGLTGKQSVNGIVAEVISQMDNETIYIIGPGTTTRAIMKKINLKNTLLGVDVILNDEVIANDVSEQKLWEIINTSKRKVNIIITPIGGQGHIFGRGNQQISPRIIKLVSVKEIIIVSTKDKLYTLPSFKLFVDTGDSSLDEELCGYSKVVTGFKDFMMCDINA